ncbi:MAG: hypothetical protein ABWZ77_01425 [Naasia sp.]
MSKSDSKSGKKAAEKSRAKSSKSAKSSKKKSTPTGPSIDELIAAVNEAAREQVAAETSAVDAAARAAAKKKALAEARANAAAAAKRAERAAKELRVAQGAAQQAAEDQKTAAKKAKKATKAKKAAQDAAVELAERTRTARVRLDKVPPAQRGLTEIGSAGTRKAPEQPDSPSAASGRKEPRGTGDATTAGSLEQEATAQIAAPAEALPETVPTELTVVEPVATELPQEDASVDPGDIPVSSTGPAIAADLDAALESVVTAEPAASLADASPLLESTDVAAAVVAVVDHGDSPSADWTLARLRILARHRGVRGYSAMSKARLLDVLTTEDPELTLRD